MRQGRTRAPGIEPVDWAGAVEEMPEPGRTLLLDFFSLGDPAGLAELPRLRELADHYRDAGLSVIGVHVPAYDFERPVEIARREMWRLGIPYPVALDHGFETFRAYGLGDLPARVVVDGAGFVRAWDQGPGDPELLERALRSLLSERQPPPPLPPPLGAPSPPVGRRRLRWRPTPEIRFGTRGVGFGPPAEDGDAGGTEREFPEPPELRGEGLAYPRGRWSLGRERIVTIGGDCGLSVVFEGSSAGAVLSRADPEGEPVEVEVVLDGEPPGERVAGADVERSADGTSATLIVDRGGLYELLSGPDFGIHHLDLRFRGEGAAVHLLHFGTTDVPDVA